MILSITQSTDRKSLEFGSKLPEWDCEEGERSADSLNPSLAFCHTVSKGSPAPEGCFERLEFSLISQDPEDAKRDGRDFRLPVKDLERGQSGDDLSDAAVKVFCVFDARILAFATWSCSPDVDPQWVPLLVVVGHP